MCREVPPTTVSLALWTPSNFCSDSGRKTTQTGANNSAVSCLLLLQAEGTPQRSSAKTIWIAARNILKTMHWMTLQMLNSCWCGIIPVWQSCTWSPDCGKRSFLFSDHQSESSWILVRPQIVGQHWPFQLLKPFDHKGWTFEEGPEVARNPDIWWTVWDQNESDDEELKWPSRQQTN